MARHSLIIAFDRPLRAAQLTNNAAPVHTPAELAAARAEGFRAGEASAQSFSNQQLVELRSEVQHLQAGLFAKLAEAQEMLTAQVKAALPVLTIELGARLLGGFEPEPKLVEKMCREALDELYPERAGLELVVSPRDAAILRDITPGWATHFPNLTVTEDDTLAPGDCLVRSRFGVTDARARVKLDSLRHELLHA